MIDFRTRRPLVILAALAAFAPLTTAAMTLDGGGSCVTFDENSIKWFNIMGSIGIDLTVQPKSGADDFIVMAQYKVSVTSERALKEIKASLPQLGKGCAVEDTDVGLTHFRHDGQKGCGLYKDGSLYVSSFRANLPIPAVQNYLGVHIDCKFNADRKVCFMKDFMPDGRATVTQIEPDMIPEWREIADRVRGAYAEHFKPCE